MKQKDKNRKKFQKTKRQDHATKGNNKRWKEYDPWLGFEEDERKRNRRRQELRQGGVIDKE